MKKGGVCDPTFLKHIAIYCYSHALNFIKEFKIFVSEVYYVDHIIFLLGGVFIRIKFREKSHELIIQIVVFWEITI